MRHVSSKVLKMFSVYVPDDMLKSTGTNLSKEGNDESLISDTKQEQDNDDRSKD